MTKTPETKAETEPKESAVQTPEQAAAAEVEADRLFREMAAKHTDPHKSDLRFKSEDGDEGDEDGDAQNTEVDADAKAKQEAQPEPKPEPTKEAATIQTPEPGKEPAAKSASKDAPAADDIWAKSATDPETAALKKAYDEAPESARPAIEAAQKRVLARGQEIHRLRTERSTLKREKTAAAATVKEPDEQPYDLTKDPEWLKAKEEYPEALSAVEKVLTRALGSTTKQIEAKVAPIAAVTAAHDEAFEEQGLRAQNDQLHRLHPNYTEVVRSGGFRDAFDSWLDDQPEEIQAMVDVNRDYVRDANKASRVFKLFQADTGFGVAQAAKEPETKETAKQPESAVSTPATDPAKQARRRSQLNGSASVEARGQSSVGADPNDEEYWRNYWIKKKSDQLSAENRVH